MNKWMDQSINKSINYLINSERKMVTSRWCIPDKPVICLCKHLYFAVCTALCFMELYINCTEFKGGGDFTAKPNDEETETFQMSMSIIICM